MRIGVVTTSYPRFPGDYAGHFVAGLTQWIAEQGHSVEVVAADDVAACDRGQPWPVTRVSAPEGLFYAGGAPDMLARGRALGKALRFSISLSRAVQDKARNWDGIVAHWLAPSALAAARARPMPLWAIAHGGDVHLLRKLRLGGACARVLERRNARVSFVSKALQRAFAEEGRAARRLAEASVVAPMGIDTAHFAALAPARDTQRPLLLFLGRLVPIKGVDILLDALARAAGDWDVCIAGSGPSEPALRAQAARLGLRVHFAGDVLGAKRDALLARATLVVIPSRPCHGRQEGMPQVALEALAAGAELLVSRTGGLAEIPESICHHVDPGDSEQLADALDAIARGSRAAYAPGHWLEEHDWNAVAPRLLRGLGRG